MYRCGKNGKTFCIFIVISVIWLHTYISNLRTEISKKGGEGRGGSGGGGGSDGEEKNGGGGGEHGRFGTPAFINLPPESHPLDSEEIDSISKEIEKENEAQTIYNLDKFGEVNEDTFVIVVQVHSRIEYLMLLIDSLYRVQSIDNTLLIFSHDLFIPQLNEAIRTIDFTRVMQIFYPNSIQLNPRRFPGQGKSDCPRDATPEEAKKLKCENADHPDIHGHYREARYTQTKHHWWWKANFVFEKLRVLQNYSGVIAFLEEDHYVTPDFLWILNLMETTMIRNLCRGCNLIALGTYLKAWNIRSSHNKFPVFLKTISYLYPSIVSTGMKKNAAKAVATNWVSSKHNMGMAFNRTLWDKIRACSKTFCEYDDYNWDWSLLQVSYACLPSTLTVFFPKAPRIFHIGDCGIHHKRKQCDPSAAAQAIDKGIKQNSFLLFPDNLSLEVKNGKKMRLKKGNGGWGDLRDKQMCLSFSN